MTPPSPALLFVAGALCASVTIAVLLRHPFYSRRVRLPFSILTLSCAVWATAYGFQLTAASLDGKLLWVWLWWTAAAFTPTLWFVFSLAYAGDDSLLSRRTLAALSVEPALVALLAFAGITGRTDLFVADFGLVSAPSAASLSVSYGPLYEAHLLYAAALSVTGTVAVGRLLVRGDDSYQRGTVVVLAAASIPLAAFASRLLGLSQRADALPVALGLAALVVLFGLRTDDLFDVTPVARDYAISEMRDGIVVLDDRARVVELNPAALPLFTVPQEEVVGSHVADVSHNSLGMYALLDGDRDRLDLTVEVEEGSRHYEATATALGNGEGHERGWTLVLRDTTERRRTEAKFRALIENSRDLVSILDRDGTRRYTSPASEHVLGIPRHEFEDSNAFDRIHPDDREQARELFEKIDSRETARTEFRHEHADGSWRVLDTVAVNMLDDPAVDGVVVNSRDVTNRRRYQQRLRVLNRVLRHDLRNDMNVILGHADLLAETIDDPARRKHVETIRKKALSLVSLGERAREVDQTLHGEDRERQPVEVTSVVRAKVEELRETHSSVVVNTHLPDEQWVLATNHVGTALTNVVDNALEHNDRILPRVGISVSRHAGSDDVEIRVVDNGPGIPASELEALEAGIETQLQHASGLGLWLVKWILNGSYASIDFEERDARGTAVVMRFQPASPPRASTDSADGDEVVRQVRETGEDDRTEAGEDDRTETGDDERTEARVNR